MLQGSGYFVDAQLAGFDLSGVGFEVTLLKPLQRGGAKELIIIVYVAGKLLKTC